MINKTDKFFKTCFVTDVVIGEELITLSDPSHNSFVIYKSDLEVLNQFKKWFRDVYSACIPQVLTMLEYAYADKNEYETLCVVKSMKYRLPNDAKESNA